MAAYSSFSLKSVKKQFGLQVLKAPLFAPILPITPSERLVAALELSELIPMTSEKSRSEWLVAPILLELKVQNRDKMSILSGENLDADKNLNLTGECDFVFSRNPNAQFIETPIFCLIEAEKHDIPGGMGQCVAQMIGARMLNEQEDVHFPAIYGCVTTGRDWQFLKLQGDTVTIHLPLLYLNDVPHILGIFQIIIDEFA
jgi:hypothetical protein